MNAKGKNRRDKERFSLSPLSFAEAVAALVRDDAPRLGVGVLRLRGPAIPGQTPRCRPHQSGEPLGVANPPPVPTEVKLRPIARQVILADVG